MRPPRTEVFVLWQPPPVDVAALRRVVADVRARLRAGRCDDCPARCAT